MKRRILIITGLMLFVAANVRAAGDWDIYSDAEIHDGDEYWNVGVYDTPPDHTTLDMFGGLVDSMAAFDESTVNISGGYVSTLNSYELSTVNAFGGFVHTLEAWDNGTVNVWGDASINALIARDDSGVVNMSGGTTYRIGAAEFGIVNLSGGFVLDNLSTDSTGTINIYGYDLFKASDGGTYGFGLVSGYWANDTAFSIDLMESTTYPHVMLIPEPGTILLIFAGSFFLRSYGKSRKGQAIWDD